MTDTENMPVCRAQYSLNDSGPWDCILSENHVGPHKDEDGDRWDLTYRDRPQCPVTTDGGTFRCSQRQWHDGPHTIQLLAPEPEPKPVVWSLERLTERVIMLEEQSENTCPGVYYAPEGEREGNYLADRPHDDLFKELFQRLSEVEAARDRQRRGIADTANRVTKLEETRNWWRATTARVSQLEKDVHPEECHGEKCVKSAAVTLSTDEYAGLLKDREELHTLRNAAQCTPETDLLGLLRDRAQSYPDDVTYLRKRSDRLARLEAAGVDNWEGYSHAMSDPEDDEEPDTSVDDQHQAQAQANVCEPRCGWVCPTARRRCVLTSGHTGNHLT